MSRERVLIDVQDELFRQDDRWGQQNHPLPVYYSILAEECGEVAKAINEWYHNKGLQTAVREELIQTAAVAIAMVEMIDRGAEEAREIIERDKRGK